MELEIKEVYLNSVSTQNYLDHIPIIDVSISYDDFFQKYLIKNQACVIKNVASAWESKSFWTKNGKPNFSYLEDKYAELDVTIYDCKEKYYNSQKTKPWKFGEYITYWKEYIVQNYSEDMPLLYLKDWHLKNNNEDDKFYEVPHMFASDWLNEYFCENSLDDYRFVYMGPKGSWTPFHADVFTSYSWSVNICGEKRWILFPPGAEDSLRDDLQNLPYDVLTSKYNLPFFEIIQQAGDAVFVPSGWHHQVWNTRDTISINHNWVNSCNLKTMYYSIVDNLNSVKNEIKDCSNMEGFLEHCQVMLRASYGLDFYHFYKFLKYIALKRLKILKEGNKIHFFNGFHFGKHHVIYDLISIKDVLKIFLLHDDVIYLTTLSNLSITPRNLLENIVSELNLLEINC